MHILMKGQIEKMSSEFFDSLEMIEAEKGISRDVVLDALESS